MVVYPFRHGKHVVRSHQSLPLGLFTAAVSLSPQQQQQRPTGWVRGVSTAPVVPNGQQFDGWQRLSGCKAEKRRLCKGYGRESAEYKHSIWKKMSLKNDKVPSKSIFQKQYIPILLDKKSLIRRLHHVAQRQCPGWRFQLVLESCLSKLVSST